MELSERTNWNKCSEGSDIIPFELAMLYLVSLGIFESKGESFHGIK